MGLRPPASKNYYYIEAFPSFFLTVVLTALSTHTMHPVPPPSILSTDRTCRASRRNTSSFRERSGSNSRHRRISPRMPSTHLTKITKFQHHIQQASSFSVDIVALCPRPPYTTDKNQSTMSGGVSAKRTELFPAHRSNSNDRL